MGAVMERRAALLCKAAAAQQPHQCCPRGTVGRAACPGVCGCCRAGSRSRWALSCSLDLRSLRDSAKGWTGLLGDFSSLSDTVLCDLWQSNKWGTAQRFQWWCFFLYKQPKAPNFSTSFLPVDEVEVSCESSWARMCQWNHGCATDSRGAEVGSVSQRCSLASP